MDSQLYNVVLFLLRWMHFFFGIIWIGLLYYFNFVQGAFFNETDANTKSAAVQKLVPRALWWFRWGAMVTFITGWAYLGMWSHNAGMDVYYQSWGVFILTGVTLGSLMWANVWFVIWPNQKIVIQSTTQAATGGQPLPNAAAAGTRAMVASRTNTMFSIPMLFFMGAASHNPFSVNPDFNGCRLALIIGLILVALEINALKGKTGPMTTIRGVITCGFALTAVLCCVIGCLV